MKYLELLYYRYYRFQVKIGNADVAPFSTILIIAFITMLYYFDFFIVLSVLFPNKSPDLSWKFNLILLLFLIVFLYFILVHKGKYKEILKEHEKSKPNKGKWFAVLFALTAFVVFNLGFIFKILQNQGKL